MPNQKNNRHHSVRLYLNKADEALRQAMEVDTNVHEDSNREKLLDDSFHAFIESIEDHE